MDHIWDDTCWPVRLWGLDIFGYGDRLLLVRSEMFRVVGARWSHSFATIIVACFDLTMAIFSLGHWYYGEECILDMRWIPCYRDTTLIRSQLVYQLILVLSMVPDNDTIWFRAQMVYALLFGAQSIGVPWFWSLDGSNQQNL